MMERMQKPYIKLVFSCFVAVIGSACLLIFFKWIYRSSQLYALLSGEKVLIVNDIVRSLLNMCLYESGCANSMATHTHYVPLDIHYCYTSNCLRIECGLGCDNTSKGHFTHKIEGP